MYLFAYHLFSKNQANNLWRLGSSNCLRALTFRQLVSNGVLKRKGSQWLSVTKLGFDSWALPSKARARHWAIASLDGGVRTAVGTSGVPASSSRLW